MPSHFFYSRWDGTQKLGSLNAEQLLESLTSDYLTYGELEAALQRLYRNGADQVVGLDQLLRELREKKQAELARYHLDSALDSLNQRLAEVTAAERTGIAEKLRQASPENRQLLQKLGSQHLRELDAMPNDIGGRIQALGDYEFLDDQARRQFEELLQELRDQVMQQMLQGLKQSLGGLDASSRSQVREMLRDLNRMLSQQQAGRTVDMAPFRKRFGSLLPPGIETLEQLLEHLQRQSAQMSSLLRSLSSGAREELRQLVNELFQDESLRRELARLRAHLQRLRPASDASDSYSFFGEEPLDLRQAVALMERLQSLDRLQAQMEGPTFRSELVDRGLLEEMLGEKAGRQFDQLSQIVEKLETAGYLERGDRGLELTPRAMRRIGHRALMDIFSQLEKSQAGQHHLGLAGAGPEQGSELKLYEYGDAFSLDLRETLFDALIRSGPGIPVQLQTEDFVVHRHESETEAATVLMVDLSRSMLLRGCLIAAKKLAMALEALIRSRYPRDHLYLVGFSDHAVRIELGALPRFGLNDYVYGTNMQHGFQLSRALLARHRGNRQIIMVSDGEPTAHLEAGQVYFAYPPTSRTLHETLKEVARCTRDHIRISTFMLERGAHLAEFVTEMTRINRGRAFFVAPDRLGEYVLVDFVRGHLRQRSMRAAC
jgi:uncharacterized protein with von Willebrand factor type A (vWA) domain